MRSWCVGDYTRGTSTRVSTFCAPCVTWHARFCFYSHGGFVGHAFHLELLSVHTYVARTRWLFFCLGLSPLCATFIRPIRIASDFIRKYRVCTDWTERSLFVKKKVRWLCRRSRLSHSLPHSGRSYPQNLLAPFPSFVKLRQINGRTSPVE